jgi:hypothetical protein
MELAAALNGSATHARKLVIQARVASNTSASAGQRL